MEKIFNKIHIWVLECGGKEIYFFNIVCIGERLFPRVINVFVKKSLQIYRGSVVRGGKKKLDTFGIGIK